MTETQNKIAARFSRSAEYYDRNTVVQKQTAERLARALEPWRYSVPEGPVLEIGAGTGFFTRFLADIFPARDVVITDASEEMLSYCRQKMDGYTNLGFRVLDAETEDWKEGSFSLIAGNFVMQWFKNPSVTLAKMCEALKPGGLLLVSFPGSESYPDWKKYCLELGIPFTANPLPDVEQLVISLSMGPVQVDYYEDETREVYEDLYSFFRHLKRSGAGTSLTGKKLTPRQLGLLNNYWLKQNPGKVTVRYHTVFLAAKKDLNS